MRTLELMSYFGTMGDLNRAKRNFPGVTFRYLVVPQTKLPTSNIPIGFKHDQIMAMIN